MRLCIVGDACCYRFSKTLLFIGKCLSEVACETKPSGAFKGRCRFVGIGQVLDRAPLVPAHESAGGWHTVLASDILSSRGRTLTYNRNGNQAFRGLKMPNRVSIIICQDSSE
ncbi:hypothetical protein NE237_001848 [Protea cynaroides]|uniref:Uncharacterized protein n=1 Tax=Protea cynaroides TaxID=273540 RepID=A0A9Q0KU50_9MAGN|nr:hypothetical protein NE237_001848 [Protea cynaroides]